MNERPISVILIGGLFIAAGAFGLAHHAGELDLQRPFENDAVWAIAIRGLAVAGGAFVLRGRNWARWLLVAWMAYHAALSAFHSVPTLIFHIVLLVVVAWLLFRPPASAYFRGGGGRGPHHAADAKSGA